MGEVVSQPISPHVSSSLFMKTDDESKTHCGNLFHSSIILFEKNVFRAVGLHLGLKGFCECPVNPRCHKTLHCVHCTEIHA